MVDERLVTGARLVEDEFKLYIVSVTKGSFNLIEGFVESLDGVQNIFAIRAEDSHRHLRRCSGEPACGFEPRTNEGLIFRRCGECQRRRQ